MEITIIAVGKIKEKYLKAGIERYSKELSKFCRLQIVEIPDEKTPEDASLKEELQIKDKEGEGILRYVKEDSFVIALVIEGKLLTSEEFDDFIRKINGRGNHNIAFIIGGSLGLSQKVLERADYKLSFSKMTFPHQLMRVILLEQLSSISSRVSSR